MDMADSFAVRFAAVRARFGPLTWGLDPSGALLDRWGLRDSADGLDRFADLVLEAAAGTVGLIKPQSAFYERHGWRGIRTLERLIAGACTAGLLVGAQRGRPRARTRARCRRPPRPWPPRSAPSCTEVLH
jgi:orotidine-5'-phosphate decarboxylase